MLLAALPLLFATPDFDAAGTRVRALIEKFVAIDTSTVHEDRIAHLAEERLQPLGLETQILVPAPDHGILVARLKGNGTKKPLLLIAHIDTVGANKDEWKSDPWTLTERDGYLYGRGVIDDKGMAAMAIEAVALLAEEKDRARDVILVLAGDEESGVGVGTQWLVEHHPELVRDVELELNEGGDLSADADGKPRYVSLQNSEKNWQNFELVATGPGGHSSAPLPDNAIWRLAKAMTRVEGLEPPPRLTATTRAWFAGRAKIEKQPATRRALAAVADAKGNAPPAWAVKALSSDPEFHAQLRSTCVPTLLAGGSRVNALPTEAKVTINCRMIPGEDVEAFAATLKKAIADPKVELRYHVTATGDSTSPPDGPMVDAVKRATAQMFPAIPVVPYMSSGGTDSKKFRALGISSYGLDPFPMSEEDERRMHGPEERMQIDGPRVGVEYLHRILVEAAK